MAPSLNEDAIRRGCDLQWRKGFLSEYEEFTELSNEWERGSSRKRGEETHWFCSWKSSGGILLLYRIVPLSNFLAWEELGFIVRDEYCVQTPGGLLIFRFFEEEGDFEENCFCF